MFKGGMLKEEEYIGEVPYYHYIGGTYGVHPIHNCDSEGGHVSWMKFTSDDRDIYRDHDEYVSIKGTCFKRADVMFYDQVKYQPFRDKIERRYKA